MVLYIEDRERERERATCTKKAKETSNIACKDSTSKFEL